MSGNTSRKHTSGSTNRKNTHRKNKPRNTNQTKKMDKCNLEEQTTGNINRKIDIGEIQINEIHGK